ncbi:MAG: M15 family metallopeptidase [Polymorphobacter sp.]
MIDDRAIQRALIAKGFLSGTADGDYGSGSRKAARAALLAAGHAEAAGWGDARCKIAFQQVMLTEAGCAPGMIDGYSGPQLLVALEKWQNSLRDITPPPPEVAHQSPVWPRQDGVPGFFGAKGTGLIAVPLPYPMKLAWDLSVTVTRMQMHEKVAASATRALTRALAHYGRDQLAALRLDITGGCYNDRLMKGGTRPSMHSWGIAIDFDPDRNQLRWGREKAWLARAACVPFLDFWAEEGWISLGRERNFDWMHVQAARL